jgi:predicted ferric reductase
MDMPTTHSSVFIKASGDWTEKLHDTIKRDSNRPIWLKGPFASPFAAALDFDNIVLIASGIGITPAVACIQQYRDDRVINLIWVCREASMIDFYARTCVDLLHRFAFVLLIP